MVPIMLSWQPKNELVATVPQPEAAASETRCRGRLSFAKTPSQDWMMDRRGEGFCALLPAAEHPGA
jgi:hypothetical protein